MGETGTASSLSDRTKYVAFAGLGLSMLLGGLDQTIVATALPTIASEFGSLDQLFWVVTAYLVTSTAVTPLYGKLSDIYGRRLLTQIAIVIFLVGSALSGLSQSMVQLALLRGLQGIGGGGLMAMAMAGIGDIFTPRERGKYMSYLQLVNGSALIGGPLLGGFLTDQFTWRWIFYINIPLGIIALALIQIGLDVPVPNESHRIDYEGAGLIVIAVSALVALTSWGGDQYAWGSWQILGLVAVAVVGTVLFVVQERRIEEPIISLELFRNRSVLLITVLAVLIGGVLMGVVNYIPVFMRMVLGKGGTNTGLLLMPLFVGFIVSAMTGGQLMSRIGRYKFITVAGLVVSLVGCYLLSTMGMDVSSLQTTLYMFVTGLMGMTLPTLSTAIQNAVSGDDIGEVSSLYSFGRNLGGALGVSAFGIVFNRQLTAELRDALPNGVDVSAVSQSPQAIHQLSPQLQQQVMQALVDSFHAVFLVGVGVLGVSLLVSLVLPNDELKEESGAEMRAAADGGAVEDDDD
ncbi:MFS transporter [Haladaptatus sp. AB618]|uniref:MDR family MFS transporter n=1 Tax=Haladaptatus sp. AB618 TaxID=2934173 RepID=UPI00209BC715|nr:MDR family MFS transporter [Haladaptatus sp. AB618]MCO8255995.1 MFS transporter [Haladaptatus sp. AB618]